MYTQAMDTMAREEKSQAQAVRSDDQQATDKAREAAFEALLQRQLVGRAHA